MKKFFERWQEFLGWSPLVLALAVGAWVVFGALDRTAGTDMLARLIELPIRALYVGVALAFLFLARRRQRRRLTDEEQSDLWKRLVAGHRGALIIYITDTVVWLCGFVLLLLFFWP